MMFALGGYVVAEGIGTLLVWDHTKRGCVKVGAADLGEVHQGGDLLRLLEATSMNQFL